MFPPKNLAHEGLIVPSKHPSFVYLLLLDSLAIQLANQFRIIRQTQVSLRVRCMIKSYGLLIKSLSKYFLK